MLTQRPFPNFSELQGRVDGVNATFRHRDAVDVAVRESTRLVRELRQFCDVVPRRGGLITVHELHQTIREIGQELSIDDVRFSRVF